MKRTALLGRVVQVLLLWCLAPALGLAQAEVEPNDSKALANLYTLPAVSAAGVVTGNSTSAAGVGLDYFRINVPPQATPGYYRHRLIVQSSLVGHTLSVRGLNQVAGIPGTADSTVQSSSTLTVPPRFVQWYTAGAGAGIYVRVTGTAATIADYGLDYEVQVVSELAGPDLPQADPAITVTSVGQSAPQIDTDLWVYDADRVALVGYGNDDQFGSASLGSALTRDYPEGDYFLAISNFNLANSLGSPVDDRFRSGLVLDFPGALANSSTTVNLNLSTLIGGIAQPATKQSPYEIVFVRFGRFAIDPILIDGFETAAPAPAPAAPD